MKLVIFLSSLLAIGAWAQTPAQTPPQAPAQSPVAGQIPPDTVLATIDGKKLTYGDFEKFLQAMPPQVRESATRNRRQFIQRLALMQRLSAMAEQSKLDQKSPYKEAIDFNRMNILMQAQINAQVDSFPIRVEEQQKYYEENKAKYQQVKLKVIYIPFTANAGGQNTDGKKRMNEEEAKARTEQLVKEIKGGADFVKLVKENSEDATSKDKDGDFGTISRADNLPESIRSVVFGLKAGDVSEPVRQPNGFYIFRAEEVSEKPFAEVRDQIFTDIKNIRLKEWLDTTSKSLDIKYENDMVFSATPQVVNPPASP